MNSCPFPVSRALAQINTSALVHNLRTVSTMCAGRTIAVVKANAYGHGIDLVVPALTRAGCDFFAVATPEEALAVRSLSPGADILILGYTPPRLAPLLAKERLTQSVFSAPYALALCAAASTPVSIHLKINSGMCRLGFDIEDATGLGVALHAPKLTVRGLFTHLPSVTTSPAATAASIAKFSALRQSLPSLFAHVAATGALTIPEARFDGVRPGLALYGYSGKDQLPLRPAMRVLAPIIQIRSVDVGTPVGYDGAFVTKRPSRIGVLPLGYADGLCRALEGLRVRLCAGKGTGFAPIVGHICMDHCMIDLTDTDAKEGDTVCVISNFKDVAARRGSIVYEALTSLSPRLERQQREEDT